MKRKIITSYQNNANIYRLAIVCIVLFVVMAVLRPGSFLSFSSYNSIASQIPILGLFSIAMMFSILSGGIDLSVVGISNLAGIVTASILIKYEESGAASGFAGILVLVFAASIAVGGLLGAVNGILIAKFRIPAMLATLGTMYLYTGIGIGMTQAKTLSGFPAAFSKLATGRIGILPYSLLILIAALVITALLLNKTKFGYELRLYGTSPVASGFSGINNMSVVIRTYLYGGVMCGIAGVLMTAMANSAKAEYGSTYMFNSLLCAILGGTNPNGGEGRISGLILSLVSLQILATGFNMLRISSTLSDFVWGALLLVVMLVNAISEDRSIRKKVAKS